MHRRRGYQNLALALARRELCEAPPGSTGVRRLYENAVPSVPFPQLSPPHDLCICRFTPCGKYLVAFNPVRGELVLFRFRGLQLSVRGDGGDVLPAIGPPGSSSLLVRVKRARSPSREHAVPSGALDPGAAAALAGLSASAQPSPEASSLLMAEGAAQQQQQGGSSGIGGGGGVGVGVGGGGAGHPPGGPQLPQVQFGDAFEPYARLQITTCGDEQLATDFALVAHGRLLLVASTSPEGALADADGVLPLAEATTLHLVDLDSARVVDRHVIGGDCVELSRHQGAHLLGDLLLVLGISSQSLYLIQVLPSGRLLPLHTVGQHCRDDDALVIARARHAEQRLQQERAATAAAAAAAAASAGASAAGGAALVGESLPRGPAGLAAAAAAGAPPAHAQLPQAVLHARRGPPQPAVPAEEVGVDSDSELEEREAAGAPPLVQGLKQRLLTYLFRQALQQCRPAADAGAGNAAAGAQPDPGGGDGSQPGAAGGAGQGWAAPPGSGAPQQQQRLADRRPLDRFFYNFEPFQELVMWKAQFLDRQRLLVQWVAPDLLVGPHRHQAAQHSPPHTHPQGAYLMVYNMATTLVEALFGANSQQLTEWYLQHAEQVQCGAPASRWERYCLPAAATRQSREAQARDPHQFMRELRQRLGDELPVPCQQQSASPYLDRTLYLYDDRFISPTIKGHHPPHRAIKFMCCCQPERLRFKLEPQDVAQGLTGGGRGGSRVHQVVYLFHPFQPFMLAVVQDTETGQPERVTAFARLA